MIDLSGLDKALVLASLYNRSKPLGLGFLQATPEDMTVEEARNLLDERSRFDYLKGRVMKIDLSGDNLDPRLYNRDIGVGAAESVVESLRKNQPPPENPIDFETALQETIAGAKPTTINKENDRAVVINLGIGDPEILEALNDRLGSFKK